MDALLRLTGNHAAALLAFTGRGNYYSQRRIQESMLRSITMNMRAHDDASEIDSYMTDTEVICDIGLTS
jgi:hypothetical protein